MLHAKTSLTHKFASDTLTSVCGMHLLSIVLYLIFFASLKSCADLQPFVVAIDSPVSPWPAARPAGPLTAQDREWPVPALAGGSRALSGRRTHAQHGVRRQRARHLSNADSTGRK